MSPLLMSKHPAREFFPWSGTILIFFLSFFVRFGGVMLAIGILSYDHEANCLALLALLCFALLCFSLVWACVCAEKGHGRRVV